MKPFELEKHYVPLVEKKTDLTGYSMAVTHKNITDKSNKTCRIAFDTQELTEEQFLMVRACRNLQVLLTVIPDKAVGLNVIEPPKKGSLSQQLMNAQRDWFIEKNGNCVEFNEFRDNWKRKKIREFENATLKLKE